MQAAAPFTHRQACQSLWLDNITRKLLTADDNAEEILARFERAGIEIAALASDLQREGAKSSVDSWNELMAGIASKSEVLRKAG
jgi:hypothetical protein